VAVAQITTRAGKALLTFASGVLISGCVAVSVASGVVGAGVAVATTAVDVGVSVGKTAVGATTKVIKAAVPGD
jgi:hypothetical protein